MDAIASTSCAHKDAVPLGTRRDFRRSGKKSQEWNRLGRSCVDCGAIRLEGGAWIPTTFLERVARQAACAHAERSARYKRGEMYLKTSKTTGKRTKVQPWEPLGLACDTCGFELEGNKR